MTMTFSHLKIEPVPVPAPLGEVLDEKSAYSQKVAAQMNLVVAAPALLRALRDIERGAHPSTPMAERLSDFQMAQIASAAIAEIYKK